MITGRDIIEAVAAAAGVTPDDIVGASRSRHIVRPRQTAMYLVRALLLGSSYPAIGRMFGGRDHTTVLHAVTSVEARLSDPDEVQRISPALVLLGLGPDLQVACETIRTARPVEGVDRTYLLRRRRCLAEMVRGIDMRLASVAVGGRMHVGGW